MKLQPMVDFVLEQKQILDTEYDDCQDSMDFTRCDNLFIHRISNYVNFFKQPLTLGMFVPVNREGKPYDLKEVEAWKNHDHYSRFYKEELSFFEEAKEKVLFEGFSIAYDGESTISVCLGDVNISFSKWTLKSVMNYTIEDLCLDEPELTPSAIKKIRL